MNDKTSNPTAPKTGPEPYGQAALLLVESLIHGLIARSALTVEQAIEIIQIAADVKQDEADHVGETPATLKNALHLLNSISASLMHDLPRS